MKERCEDAKGLSAAAREDGALITFRKNRHEDETTISEIYKAGAHATIAEMESFICKYEARYLRLPNLSEVLDHMKRWAEL